MMKNDLMLSPFIPHVMLTHNHVKKELVIKFSPLFFGGILKIYKVPSKYTIEL
jgi:hypothetical protein